MIQPVPNSLSVTNAELTEHESRPRTLLKGPSSSRLNVSVVQGNERPENTQDTFKSSLQDPEKVNKLLEQARESLKELDHRVELSLDTELNTVIVRVLDQETGDLKKQFPPEDLLELKRFLHDHSGLFVEEKV